ncbi:MAG TPA: RraA family protein [Acidobacteriota bacterium]
MNTPLSNQELAVLQRIPTPTISNAIEKFNLRGRDSGFTSGIHCLFPELGAVVGYAGTATVRSARAPAGNTLPLRRRYWEYLRDLPKPTIVVMRDLDNPPLGAFWGEVNANIHRALGCAGVVVEGTVRDLDEVRGLGFHFFASAVSVSHAYAHLDDFGKPVQVGGLTVQSGDLIHADKHGVMVIPHQVAREVAAAAAEVEKYERPIISLCKSPEFSIDKLEELFKREVI